MKRAYLVTNEAYTKKIMMINACKDQTLDGTVMKAVLKAETIIRRRHWAEQLAKGDK